MAKQLFRIIKMVVSPHSPPESIVVGSLPKSKAEDLRDKLNEATLETFNPDRVVSYLVKPV